MIVAVFPPVHHAEPLRRCTICTCAIHGNACKFEGYLVHLTCALKLIICDATLK